jgi:phosphopantetheinyl transferase
MSGKLWQCRYCSLAECGLASQASVERAAKRWLSAEEQNELSRLRSPLRRRSWVAGRIAVKGTLQLNGYTEAASPQEITIRSRNPLGHGTSPRVFIGGQERRVSLSVSHVAQGVLVGMSAADELRVGVDLVGQERCGLGFRRLWFTEEEQALMRRPCGRFSAATLWAAKESVFKVLNACGSFSPRRIEIRPMPDGRLTCRIDGRDAQADCEIYDWHIEAMSACLAVRQLAGRHDSQQRPWDPGFHHD